MTTTCTEPQRASQATREATGGTLPRWVDSAITINAESRTYWDGDDLVSLLSVHTLVCPLIRAELRGESQVRVLVYYHSSTRLGLCAYEAILRADPRVHEQLGLCRFVQHTLKPQDGNLQAQMHDPTVRELYLHEIIRRLSPSIASYNLQSDAFFDVTQLV